MRLSNAFENKVLTHNGEILEIPKWLENNIREALKEWRKEQAYIVGLPAYCVFPNTTLERLVKVLPCSPNKLWLVAGFSKVLIDTYGQEVCNLIKLFLTENGISEVLLGKGSLDLSNKRVYGIVAYLQLQDYFV